MAGSLVSVQGELSMEATMAQTAFGRLARIVAVERARRVSAIAVKSS
jgi:hypothetical protein